MLTINAIFNSITKIRWWEGELDAVLEFYENVSSKKILNNLMQNTLNDPHLFGLSEQLVSLKKIVLFDDHETKTRLRLHIFDKGYSDTLIHNHKWPLYSQILCGQLNQYFYNDISSQPIDHREYTIGDSYVLAPNQFHHLTTDGCTMTLMLRGPDLVDSSQWYNKESGERWSHNGGIDDTRKRSLSQCEFREAMRIVRSNI